MPSFCARYLWHHLAAKKRDRARVPGCSKTINAAIDVRSAPLAFCPDNNTHALAHPKVSVCVYCQSRALLHSFPDNSHTARAVFKKIHSIIKKKYIFLFNFFY